MLAVEVGVCVATNALFSNLLIHGSVELNDATHSTKHSFEIFRQICHVECKRQSFCEKHSFLLCGFLFTATLQHTHSDE